MAYPLNAEGSETWLRAKGGWPALCVLCNGEAAWLMILCYEGDPGLSTRNSTYDGPTEQVLGFILANGQVDQYPASWTISPAETCRAADYFRKVEQPAPWLTWHEE